MRFPDRLQPPVEKVGLGATRGPKLSRACGYTRPKLVGWVEERNPTGLHDEVMLGLPLLGAAPSRVGGWPGVA